MYYDTTEKKTKVYSNTAWADLGGGGEPGQLPTYTTAQRDALSATTGLQIYNTTENSVQLYSQTTWKTVGVKFSAGDSCSLDGDCDSTHCVDGVCCNTTCSGTNCQTCGSLSSAGVGTCGYINSSSQDPRNTCPSTGCYTGNCSGTDYTCDYQTSSTDTYNYCGTTNCDTGNCIGGSNACEQHIVTWTYKGSSVTYGTVAHNSKCWLDRNLGASQVATSQTDSASYGDLFQWGRLDDAHQTRTSGLTQVLSITDNPGHSNFINAGCGAAPAPCDWRSGGNSSFWQGVSGINNPCPSGYRLPTITEWANERASWSSQDSAGAFASPLRLTLAGWRIGHSAGYVGAVQAAGTGGFYFSSTIYDWRSAKQLYFAAAANSADSASYLYFMNGTSVRCIRN